MIKAKLLAAVLAASAAAFPFAVAVGGTRAARLLQEDPEYWDSYVEAIDSFATPRPTPSPTTPPPVTSAPTEPDATTAPSVSPVTSAPTEPNDTAAPTASPSECITILDVACGTEGFSTLCSLLRVTGLDAAVGDPDATLTVFAPTNEAFARLRQFVSFLTDEEVIFVLLYHVHNGEVFTGNLVCDEELIMLNELYTRTECDSGALFQFGTGNTALNAPQIITPDVGVCNGVIHVVDNVILPAAPSEAPSSPPTNLPSSSPMASPTASPSGTTPGPSTIPSGTCSSLDIVLCERN